MTNDELLAKIDEYFAYGRINDTLAKALRAVVELHKPDGEIQFDLADENDSMTEDSFIECCDSCSMTYPCPTIEAIEKELK